MHLSRRKDLRIKEPKETGAGLELIVDIVKDGEIASLRPFGIAIRGSAGSSGEEDFDEILRVAMRSIVGIGQFPYPVGLLYFTMQDDVGHFTWIAEPAVTGEGPQLLLHSAAHSQKIDRDLIDQTVEKVDRWYDAFYERIAVKAS